MNVIHNRWTPGYEEGSSTTWQIIGDTPPTRMAISVPVGASGKVLVFASISRSQHDSDDVNTQYRIVVNGTEVAVTNTGGSEHWEYRQVSFFGLGVAGAGTNVNVTVEYRTQKGRVVWFDDSNGKHERQLLALTW